MKASITQVSLSLKLYEEDYLKEKLECILDVYNRPKVIVERCDDVINSGTNEEKGFHIETIPERYSFDICKEIHIFLNNNRWNQIFLGIDDDAKCGYFESRSPYDRIDFSYFNQEKHRFF